MFTPGKWIVSNERGSSGWIYVCPEDSVLPVASSHSRFPETQEADVRLIAASKDLYKAVIDLLPLAADTYGLKDPKVAAIQSIIDEVRGAK